MEPSWFFNQIWIICWRKTPRFPGLIAKSREKITVEETISNVVICEGASSILYVAHIKRDTYLSAGEFNQVLNRLFYLTFETVPTVSLPRVLLGGYPHLNLTFISFQKNRIELSCKEINASSYAAPWLIAKSIEEKSIADTTVIVVICKGASCVRAQLAGGVTRPFARHFWLINRMTLV